MRWRENIEWQNMWWESARNVKVKRIALLGDSVTRAYRSRLNKNLEGKYVVDICASSSQITDSLLWKEYRFFFECNEWNYSRIIMQGGGSMVMQGNAVVMKSMQKFLRMDIEN